VSFDGATVSFAVGKKAFAVPTHTVVGVDTGTTEGPASGIKKVAPHWVTLLAAAVPAGFKPDKDPMSGRREKLQIKRHTVRSTDKAALLGFADSVTAAVRERCPNRPKKLRVYVNPFGGKGKGVQYLAKVQPLFDAAGVTLEITQTTRAGHAGDMAQNDPLQDFDGLICVSGDGMVNEVLNGLMQREDRHRPCFGLIPAGSTNTIVWSVNGNACLTTCALRVILGESTNMDMGAVHRTGKPTVYMTNFLGYGFFGDVMKHSEGYRWMGPARYKYSGTVQVLRGRSYPTTVRYVPTDATAPVEVTARFKAVNVALLPCMTEDSKQGIVPGAKADDSTCHLILVKKCSRLKYLQFLTRITQKASQFDLGHVERIRCSEVEIRPSRQPANWNCDGELLDDPSLKVSLVPAALRCFTPGGLVGQLQVPVPDSSPQSRVVHDKTATI
jgi:ceramide kinase